MQNPVTRRGDDSPSNQDEANNGSKDNDDLRFVAHVEDDDVGVFGRGDSGGDVSLLGGPHAGASDCRDLGARCERLRPRPLFSPPRFL